MTRVRAAGGVVWRRRAPTAGTRGRAGAPAPVRRLVAAQGQAGAGRAPAGRRASARCARRPASAAVPRVRLPHRPLPDRRAGDGWREDRRLLGDAAVRRRRRSRPATRSTRCAGCRSTQAPAAADATRTTGGCSRRSPRCPPPAPVDAGAPRPRRRARQRGPARRRAPAGRRRAGAAASDAGADAAAASRPGSLLGQRRARCAARPLEPLAEPLGPADRGRRTASTRRREPDEAAAAAARPGRGRAGATVVCSQGGLIPACSAGYRAAEPAAYRTAKGDGWVLVVRRRPVVAAARRASTDRGARPPVRDIDANARGEPAHELWLSRSPGGPPLAARRLLVGRVSRATGCGSARFLAAWPAPSWPAAARWRCCAARPWSSSAFGAPSWPEPPCVAAWWP